MPRPAKLWSRKDRPGWWATISGKQQCFGLDYDEALRAFHAAKSQARRPVAPCATLVAVAVDRYLEETSTTVAAKTHANYRYALQLWVDRHGRSRVDVLEAEDLRRWLRRPSWSDSTRHLYGTAVRTWGSWCVRERLIAVNPFREVRLPSIKGRKAAPEGELERFLAAATPAFRDFLALLVEIGCRPGELATLEASKIDQGRSTAIVTGKTGERLVGLSGLAIRLLEPLIAKHPSGPVLRTPRGRPWTEANIKSHTRDLRRRTGIVGVVPYHGRHAFWSRAHKVGVSDVAIAKQLGHSDLRMLARTYSHADHEIMRETARKASGEQG